MSMLSFKRTHSTDPCEEFELHIGFCPTCIYWPSRVMVEYLKNPTLQSGLDVETEEMRKICDRLIADWPPYGVNRAMTQLELAIAFAGTRPKPAAWGVQPGVVVIR
jgi:hypothetical protein